MTTTLIVEAAVKITVLVAAGASVAAVLHRASAASRHLVWTLTAASLLLFPIASAGVPNWTIAIHVAPTPTSGTLPMAPADVRLADAAASPASVAPRTDDEPRSAIALPARVVDRAVTIAPALFLAVVVFLLCRLARERWSAHRLLRRATAIDDAAWLQLARACADASGIKQRVVLVRSGDHTMPMAIGIWRPAIVLPAVADSWPVDRRRAVLLHELAHVARHDCLTQLVAAVACAVYWPHPGVWWVARQLRIERELACDDRVLAAGAPPREYAGHLLEIAYSHGRLRAPAVAVAMARPRQLEGRMLAVLDAARNRTIPAVRSRVAACAAAMSVLVPLAAATPALVPAQQAADNPAVAQRPQPNAAAAGIAAHTLAGTWDLRVSGDGQSIQLRLNESEHSSYGITNSIDQAEAGTLLRALSQAMQPGGSGSGQIRMPRDAGTLVLDGTFRAGVGAGTYVFEPSRTFPDELVRRGFARPTVTDQYILARSNVGFAFLDALAAQGYAPPDLPQLIDAAQHGISAEYVRQMGALGYRIGRLESLVNLRDHGVSPQFIRDLDAQGLARLSANDLVRARDHGISAEYVRDLRALGYNDLSLDGLARARDRGISPAYIRSLQQFGYRLTVDGLADARQHGVSAEYISEMRELGYQLSMADLFRAREHGIGPGYIREMTAEGYDHLSLEPLVRLRQQGVDAQYVRELKKIGYENLTVDRVIAFRQEGVTASRPPHLKEAPWAAWVHEVHAFIRRYFN